AELDRKLYSTSLPAFASWWRGEQAAANKVSRATIDRWLATSPGRLDSAAARGRAWDVSTDLCSFAPNTGPVFDFRVPCIRHDFAWRNLRRLQASRGGSINTQARRLRSSRQFLRDMDTTCAARHPLQRTSCRAVARAYFTAVSAVS
ncbi:MAG: phospholipase, partial [Ilumatobacteraceae bacterium]|nr:phospholipase [Ilumatobacteraceae bacterium]